jgi:hypothetical protein
VRPDRLTNGVMLEGMDGQMYEFVVAGELTESLEASLGGLTVVRCAWTTTLRGKVRDQADLHGVLDRISALGLTLLEVRAVDDPGLRQSRATLQARG